MKEWNKEKGKNTCKQKKLRRLQLVPKAMEIDTHQYPRRGSKKKKEQKGGAFIRLSLFLPFGGLNGTGGQWRREFSPEVCNQQHHTHARITHCVFVKQVSLRRAYIVH
jgi:hypothetical protein